MTINKIQVRETKGYYGDFDGPLESIIASLQADLDAGWEGIESKYDYGYGNDERDIVYNLYKHREETDKEYDKRVKLLEKEKERKLEKLKKDLASLSAADKKLLGL
jgi:hypothetical protein